MRQEPGSGGAVHPRAVRITLRDPSIHAELDPIVLKPEAQSGVRLERRAADHAVLIENDPGDRGEPRPRRTPVVLLTHAPVPAGIVAREVLVDGWRVLVEVESAARVALRERARRDLGEAIRSDRTELRAVIPGRIVAVSVAPGDPVTAGQQVMVVEAMKMQNQLRAPRDGVVTRVDVGAGQTVELGDLLVVFE